MQIITIKDHKHIVWLPNKEIEKVEYHDFYIGKPDSILSYHSAKYRDLVYLKIPEVKYGPVIELPDFLAEQDHKENDLIDLPCDRCTGSGNGNDSWRPFKVPPCTGCRGSGEIQYRLGKVELKRAKELLRGPDDHTVVNFGLDNYILIASLKVNR